MYISSTYFEILLKMARLLTKSQKWAYYYVRKLLDLDRQIKVRHTKKALNYHYHREMKINYYTKIWKGDKYLSMVINECKNMKYKVENNG